MTDQVDVARVFLGALVLLWVFVIAVIWDIVRAHRTK